MQNKYILLVASWLIICSCSTPQKSIFSQRTQHEQYADKLIKAGLDETVLVRKWFEAASESINKPLRIELPYKETGYFSDDMPGAAGFTFNARQGEIVKINVDVKPDSVMVFADLWQQEESGSLKLLETRTDTAGKTISVKITKDALYRLRIQPPLLMATSYTLTLTTAASLAFPVPSDAKPKIGSFWGAARDGGSRSHEGIDIFGKFRTPVVAVADGYISSTRTNNLGGKVIFLRPANANYSLYYAHLDSQLVSEGEYVQTGKMIGLMGNTGNAKNTPTHLHFGIYTGLGAVDPLPYVNNQRPDAPAISASLQLVNKYARLKSNSTLIRDVNEKITSAIIVKKEDLVKITGATVNWYKVTLLNGEKGLLNSNSLSSIENEIRTIKVNKESVLLNYPSVEGLAKQIIPAETKLSVYAVSNGFYYTEYNRQYGWIEVNK